jgi:hypothetical protein
MHDSLLIARHATPFDENGFVDWMVDASPGATVAYYRGHLAYDRMRSTQALSGPALGELNRVADRVLATAEQGLVIPVQKRLGPADFLYLAVKAVGGMKSRNATLEPVAPVIAARPRVAPAKPEFALAA